MPCLFTACTGPVDLFWLGESILLCPDGLITELEVEVQVNGILRCGNKEGTNLTFVHRGAIYAIRDRSQEWLATSGPDWFSERILNNRALADTRSISFVGSDKLLIQYRKGLPKCLATVPRQENPVCEFVVYCPDMHHRFSQTKTRTKKIPQKPCFPDAIFSTFDVEFRGSEVQLFRVSFRTQFGLVSYGSQFSIEVEGPDRAINSLRLDTARNVKDPKRKAELRKKIDHLFDTRKEPQYDISIIGHPSIAYTVEDKENADIPICFAIESGGTPIVSAATPVRVTHFNMKRRDFLVRPVAQIVSKRVEYGVEFLQAIDQLGLNPK